MARGRASLEVGDLVRLGNRGRALAQYHGITADLVLKVSAALPRSVYGRKAFAVAVGERSYVVWPSQIRLVRPKPRRKREDDDE